MQASGSQGEWAIRAALTRRKREHHASGSNVLFIDELGLMHARSRVDLAVFNGHLHGYEIKSANDTLDRLPRQLYHYERALQKLSLVVASGHLRKASALLPSWCGLLEVVEGPRGGLTFVSHQRATLNPDLDPFVMAHLLWRREAQALLIERGASAADVNAPRARLYRMLTNELSLRELVPSIKAAMASRTGWRDRRPRS